jgi:hypothetical protein
VDDIHFKENGALQIWPILFLYDKYEVLALNDEKQLAA